MMKNLFIFWDEPLNLTGGGIHRTISCLMEYLPSRGFDVYYICTQDLYSSFSIVKDNKQMCQVDKKGLIQYLKSKRTGIILGQDPVHSMVLTKFIKNLDLDSFKLVNQYHLTLLYYNNKLNWDYLKYSWKTQRGVRNRGDIICKSLMYPLWRYSVNQKFNSIYRYNYDRSDITLLLSEYEKPILAKITGDSELKKCEVIPNPLSWKEIASPGVLKSKKKEVLIVSRIYNIEKRIDLSLRVWKILKDKGELDGWTLRIVGEGIDKLYLMALTKKLHLDNVIWEGRQDPRKFYKEASIFMLTSINEGWALTLTESQQNGVVPIAFDSYPAVRSIINNGLDGFIVPSKDIHAMADRLLLLMKDNEKRETMARNALKSCTRFKIDNVIDKWAEMLNKLSTQQ